jgi:hypothetical protein
VGNMESINISYKELKFLLEQKLGKRINYLYIPARSTIEGGITCVLYENVEKMEFTEKREGFYTRETPNFIATLTKIEKEHVISNGIFYGTTIRRDVWELEVRAYKETTQRTIQQFEVGNFDYENNGYVETTEKTFPETIMESAYMRKFWNNIEDIKKESERILEELRYW